MTVNWRLRELTDEGFLVRLQARGRCGGNRKDSRRCLKSAALRDEIAARNHQHRCEVLVLEETCASAEQATELNVKEGSRISTP